MGIFGSSYRKIWEEFCTLKENAVYNSGGLFKSARIEYSFKNWLIVLDVYTVSDDDGSEYYTRIRVPFVCRGDFNFKLSRKNIFKDIVTFFGATYIKTGDYNFDEKYVIKSDNSEDITRLFTDEQVKSTLLKINSINCIDIKDNDGFFKEFPSEVRQIYFLKDNIVKDEKELFELFSLFETMLEVLAENGIISEQRADIKI